MSIEPIPDIGRAKPEDLSSKTLSDGSCRIMRAGAACRCSFLDTKLDRFLLTSNLNQRPRANWRPS
jgi:hypothetical protein